MNRVNTKTLNKFCIKYELYGIINHHGNSTINAHYTCNKKINNNWVNFNDQEKKIISVEDLKKNSYIFFYKKI